MGLKHKIASASHLDLKELMDTFKKVTIACAAISCFGIGAYFVTSGVDAVASAKVKAVMAADKAMSVVDEAVNGGN